MTKLKNYFGALVFYVRRYFELRRERHQTDLEDKLRKAIENADAHRGIGSAEMVRPFGLKPYLDFWKDKNDE